MTFSKEDFTKLIHFNTVKTLEFYLHLFLFFLMQCFLLLCL